MSTRFNNGSYYDNHQRAAELHDAAAHAHRAGEERGDCDHLTGHELSRQAMENSREAHKQSLAASNGEAASFGRPEIAALAYQLWRARGCPEGSPEEDWSQAFKELRERAASAWRHVHEA